MTLNFLMIEVVDLLEQFIWPLIRISALMMTAPIFGSNALNVRIRIAVGAVITLLLFPSVTVPRIDPLAYDSIFPMLNEVFIGVSMGLALQVVSAAIILSGQVVSGGMGLGMANMIDPNLGNIPTLSNFFLVLGLLIFLSLGGHLVLISMLAESFEYLPIGENAFSLASLEAFLSWSATMFVGAVSLVLPVVVSLLMINVCLGIISRASPSLNIFAVGFPALIPIGLVLITLTTVFYYAKLETIWYAGFDHIRIFIKGS